MFVSFLFLSLIRHSLRILYQGVAGECVSVLCLMLFWNDRHGLLSKTVAGKAALFLKRGPLADCCGKDTMFSKWGLISHGIHAALVHVVISLNSEISESRVWFDEINLNKVLSRYNIYMSLCHIQFFNFRLVYFESEAACLWTLLCCVCYIYQLEVNQNYLQPMDMLETQWSQYGKTPGRLRPQSSCFGLGRLNVNGLEWKALQSRPFHTCDYVMPYVPCRFTGMAGSSG